MPLKEMYKEMDRMIETLPLHKLVKPNPLPLPDPNGCKWPIKPSPYHKSRRIYIKNKFPIEIRGYRSFAVTLRAGEMTNGTFCIADSNGNLEPEINIEQGIKGVIATGKTNAEIYLKENKSVSNDSKIAKRIINSKNIKDTFYLVYDSFAKEKIESQLGDLKDLEKIVEN